MPEQESASPCVMPEQCLTVALAGDEGQYADGPVTANRLTRDARRRGARGGLRVTWAPRKEAARVLSGEALVSAGQA